MASSKTKAVVALGLLDIVRQVAHAWSAKSRAEEQRIGFGKGIREDAVQFARDTRERIPHPGHLEWGMPPWRRTPTMADRARTWAPVALVVALSSGAVILAARYIARSEDTTDPDAAATDSRMVGAIRAGSQAIDAGVSKVVEGGSGAAVGTASAVAAGSSAVRHATVQRARVELDERVVRPGKRKAMIYGSIGVMGLTAYVIVIAVIVQLVVGAIG